MDGQPTRGTTDLARTCTPKTASSQSLTQQDSRQRQPSTQSAAQAASHLANGMNSGFWLIGIYLVVVGAAGVLLLNPDHTAARLRRSTK